MYQSAACVHRIMINAFGTAANWAKSVPWCRCTRNSNRLTRKSGHAPLAAMSSLTLDREVRLHHHLHMKSGSLSSVCSVTIWEFLVIWNLGAYTVIWNLGVFCIWNLGAYTVTVIWNLGVICIWNLGAYTVTVIWNLGVICIWNLGAVDGPATVSYC
jgi:hypothetical protein